MTVDPKDVHETLARSMLVEGYPIVLDLERSQGQWIRDAREDREYLDLMSFHAARPLGFNHPKLREAAYLERLLLAARCKPANADLHTTLYAEFVETFRTKAMGPGQSHLYFVEGGALAVENALKAAFDWKVRKNLSAGRAERDLKVIHFSHAFHGRSGYTLSLTNTSDPRKTQYFPKFDWPRVPSPAVSFPLEGGNLTRAVEAERGALFEIDEAYARHGTDSIACIIIEPIQSEGGDRYFRPEFLRALRKLCDARETLLVFDEVQTGMGATGTMWYYEQLDVWPDIVAFAKKAQTGGFMATERLDDVDSVFKVKSRLGSTFAGNLVDFVRCTRILEIIEEDVLLENVKTQGAYLLGRVTELADSFEQLTNPRGVGTLIAFDVDTTELRDKIVDRAFEEGLLIQASGDQTVRLRPALDIAAQDAELAIDLLEQAVEATLG